MTFKEAMSEMIDGRALLGTAGMKYRFHNNRLECKCANTWAKSLNPIREHTSTTWELVKRSIIIDGKTIELSEESYNELKRSLT